MKVPLPNTPVTGVATPGKSFQERFAELMMVVAGFPVRGPGAYRSCAPQLSIAVQPVPNGS